jgi:AmiR/NasT family two-component response regulator
VLKEEQLSTAIGTRTAIGTAVGIMMERYGMTQAAAFNYLLRQSSTENRKIRLIASEVVGAVEEAAHGTRPKPM